MRFAKFFLMRAAILAAVLAGSAVAKADEVRVSANVAFVQPTATNPGEFTFTSTFLYDPETSQLVPDTMFINVVDTLGGTPYTDWVPKPNFHDPVFTYLDPDGNGIQLSFFSTGGSSPLLQIGSYSISDSRLYCVTRTCAEHFSPTGDTGIPAVAGELTVSSVPEPGSGTFFICGALIIAILWTAKSSITAGPPLR
jgi:hypothetical protein